MEDSGEPVSKVSIPSGFLETAFDSGVDIINRRIYFHEDVDEVSVSNVIVGLQLLASFSNDPIDLFISSYGGNLDDAFAAYDIITTLPCDVRTIAVGKCMSAAPLILLAGTERYTTRHTTFMMHDATLGGMDGSTVQQTEASMQAAVDSLNMYAALLAKRTLLNKRHWKKLFQAPKDTYFPASEAVDWGLVHGFWTGE